MRMPIVGAFALALASAFLLYGINYDTRHFEDRLRDQARAIEEARRDIAVLKAERAHLGRPERIEPLGACARSAARHRAPARRCAGGGYRPRPVRGRDRLDRNR